MTTKNIVLDTNVLISDPTAIYKFADNTVYIPSAVLFELDNLKHRQSRNGLNREAAEAIFHIENTIASHSPEEIAAGIALKYPANSEDKGGKLAIVFHPRDKIKRILEKKSLEDIPDSNIIATALILQDDIKNITFVSQDTNARLIASSAGVEKVENYKNEDALSDLNYLPSGKVTLTHKSWDSFTYEEAIDEEWGQCFVGSTNDFIEKPYPGAYIFFSSDDDTAEPEIAGCVISVIDDQVHFRATNKESIYKQSVWGLKPKNLEQSMLIDAILDPNSQLVTAVGTSGTGKTLVSVACALELVLEKKLFDQIIICRSLVDLGPSIGALPGDEREKVQPWLEGFNDALKFLHSKDSDAGGNKSGQFKSTEYVIEKANISFKSISFLRGSSPQRALIILDEAQNTNRHVIKAVATRITDTSKCIVLGNINQCDTGQSPLQSGLIHLATKMKGFEHSKVIHLKSGQRSKLAQFAEDVL